MTVKIPYTKSEMYSAINSLDMEKLDKELIELIDKEFKLKHPKEKKTLNRFIAAENDISVESLLASPNYEVLLEEYENTIAHQLAERYVVMLGITEIEAWSIFAFKTGVIK